MDKTKTAIFLVLAIVGAVAGVILPQYLNLGGGSAGAGEATSSEAPAATPGGTLAAGGPAAALTGERFVYFDRMVVNLHDPALIKYLSIEVALRVDASDELMVKQLLEKKKPLLKDRVTTLIADKTLEDIIGKVGINRLRREIHDEFNEILFAESGIPRIQEVLFEEWHVD